MKSLAITTPEEKGQWCLKCATEPCQYPCVSLHILNKSLIKNLCQERDLHLHTQAYINEWKTWSPQYCHYYDQTASILNIKGPKRL